MYTDASFSNIWTHSRLGSSLFGMGMPWFKMVFNKKSIIILVRWKSLLIALEEEAWKSWGHLDLLPNQNYNIHFTSTFHHRQIKAYIFISKGKVVALWISQMGLHECIWVCLGMEFFSLTWPRVIFMKYTLSVKKKSALIIVGKNVSRYKKSRQK